MAMLEDFQGGEVLSASKLNKIVAEVRKALVPTPPIKITDGGSFIGIGLDPLFKDWWMGTIHGSDDSADTYSDMRYYVKKVVLNSTGLPISWISDNSELGDGFYTVTNFAEWTVITAEQTHKLAVSDKIIVFELDDDNVPPNTRYITHAGTIGGSDTGMSDHNLLDSDFHLDTLTKPATRGRMILSNSSNKWTTDAGGDIYQVLQDDGTDLVFGWVRAHA